MVALECFFVEHRQGILGVKNFTMVLEPPSNKMKSSLDVLIL
jgi:hypothetical protein